MSSPAGSGNTLAALLALLIGMSASGLSRAQSPWELAASVNLAPGESAIVEVEQQGLDLRVGVFLNESLLHEQDGPDQVFGVEVVALSNQTPQTANYRLMVAPLYSGMPVAFSIEQTLNPAPAELALAMRLSQAGAAWQVTDTAERSLALLEPLVTTPDTTRLGQLALRMYVEALQRSGQTERIVQFLAAMPASLSGNTAAQVYLRWLQATALWEALYLDEALAQIEALVSDLDRRQALAALDPATALWLRSRIDGTLGAIRLFAGRAEGNDELMHSGGAVIRQALQAAQASSDYVLQAQLTEYFGGYLSMVEGRTSAITSGLLREAEQLYDAAGDAVNLAALRNNQAYAALGNGDVGAALTLYLQALELQAGSKHLEGRAHVRARLGYLYFTLGDYRRAEIRYRESIEIYRSLQLDRKLVHNELELAEVLRAAGRFTESRDLLMQVESALREDSAVEDRLRLYTQLARTEIDLDNIAAARAAAAAAITGLNLGQADDRERLQNASRLFYRLEHEVLLGTIALIDQAYATALTHVDNGLAMLADEHQEPLQHLELLHLKMLTHVAQDEFGATLATGRDALALIENVQSNIDFQVHGPRWMARTSHVRDLLISESLAEYSETNNVQHLDYAFALLQETRARSLREARNANALLVESAQLRTLEAAVTRDRKQLIAALLQEQPVAELERQLARSEERYQLALESEQQSQRHEVPVLSIADIQSALPATAQARVYAGGGQRSHLITLSRQGVTVQALPAEAVLAQLLKDSLTEIEQAARQMPATEQLALLLFPSPAIDAVATVLLEADGILSSVPFAILASLHPETAVATSLVYVPSLSEYLQRDATRPALAQTTVVAEARLDVAIVADPAFSLGAANNSELAEWRNTLGRLPYTRVEADAILQTFAPDSAISYLGADATIENLFSDQVRAARILHIASHGFASPTDPLLLGLALANETGPGHSGLLTTEEINNFRFTNELVVISACDTAQGQVLKGEGMMSLSRAFLANGAQATVSTLWPVSDRANAQFMASFYEGLKELRLDAAAALQFAQNELKSSAQYRNPYYWGAYVLHVADSGYAPVL